MGNVVISADSHITEPPNTYVDFIEAKWKDRAPQMRFDNDKLGDAFFVDGMPAPIAMGLVAAAGTPPEKIRATGVKFYDMHPGGWDPDARMAEQDKDGVHAEVIYPTVGMVLCNHPDFDYKTACFAAYNRWIASYCGKHPARHVGLGQLAMRTPEDGIRELREIQALGLRGVMMPGNPAVEDYDSRVYDAFWEESIALGLPLWFHILTDRYYCLPPRDARPQDERLSQHHARLPGRDGWRWVFYINIIPGLLAAGLVAFAWRDQIHSHARPVVDYAGAALLTGSVVSLLLGLMNETSSSLLLVLIAVALFIALLWVENRAPDPILPLHLFRERLFAISITHGVLTGWAMFGSISFIPLFVQSVLGTSATQAGITVTPMLLGWVTASIIGTRLLLRVGYRRLAILGTSSLTVGAFLMTRIDADISQTLMMVFVALMGIGMGFSIPPFLIAVQSRCRCRRSTTSGMSSKTSPGHAC